MRHEEVRSWLGAYLEGDLGLGQRALVDAHLDSCGACAQELLDLRSMVSVLRSLPDRLRDIENFDLNLEALQDANVAGCAVNAVDAATWQVLSPDTT